MTKPIFITQPTLPPLEEFIPLLEQIWESKVLTNGGPFHRQLEDALCEYLGVKHISLFANATIALVTALKALRIGGEVITTPYSFVATAHSLLWNNINPVFVDIEPRTLNLDPSKIEDAITARTTAIMPVHCYGNPCDVDAIEAIAKKHNLKVIYDAAHAFGVECHCGSVLNHGDLSVLSFHATKVFNTFEGGAIVSPDAETKKHIDQLKNFGFTSETTVVATGINGKMNEMQAALGLLQLKYIDEAIAKRKEVAERYKDAIDNIPGLSVVPDAGQMRSNYAYFPILVGDNYPLTRDELYEKLKDHGIYARRYFYPLITDFPMYHNSGSKTGTELVVAVKFANQVICFPISSELTSHSQDKVIALLRDNIGFE